jgi:hypothetical protein
MFPRTFIALAFALYLLIGIIAGWALTTTFSIWVAILCGLGLTLPGLLPYYPRWNAGALRFAQSSIAVASIISLYLLVYFTALWAVLDTFGVLVGVLCLIGVLLPTVLAFASKYPFIKETA